MRNVEVKVYSKQIYSTHLEESEQIYQGNLALKNNSIYITYKEIETGITTIIKSLKEGISVKRIGAIGGQLFFQKDKVHRTLYSTPYGMLPIEIKTNKSEVYLLEKGIKIYIEYMIIMDEEKISDNVLMVITN